MTEPRSRPPVTLILPTYNAERFIDETLAALGAQTLPGVEYLLGDDGSTDSTPERLRAFAEGREDVTLVLRDGNLGWTGNVNDLIARARGEHLCLIGHDDLVTPDYAEALLAVMRANPGAGVVYPDMEQHKLDGTVNVAAYDATARARTGLGRVLIFLRRDRFWWTPYRGLVRTDVAQRLGGLKPHREGEFSCDFIWVAELVAHGPAIRVPGVRYVKRFLKTSLSVTWDHSRRQQAAVMEAAHRALILGPALPVHERALFAAYLLARRVAPRLVDLAPRGLRRRWRRLAGL